MYTHDYYMYHTYSYALYNVLHVQVHIIKKFPPVIFLLPYLETIVVMLGTTVPEPI